MKKFIMLTLICAMLLGTLSGCWGWWRRGHHHDKGKHFVQSENHIINDHSFSGIH